MARKSNKTSHVLNLLAGHEDKEKTAAETPDTEAATSKTENKASASPQNISVIDNTGDDALAQLIQEQLTKELDSSSEAVSDTVTDTAPDDMLEPEVAELPSLDDTPEPEVTELPSPDDTPEPEVTELPSPDNTPEPEVTKLPSPDDTPEPEVTELPSPDNTPEPEVTELPSPDDTPESIEATPVNKEPDFITLNVMEQVVKEKIIYFMRQFDVCTCDRCVADTTALALNGLAPKYIVTTPAAVDPLLSFYTNKFISDVTVEAMKACMIIKENPRHQK